MNIGYAMIIVGGFFLIYGFYRLMIKPKQEQKNAAKQIPFEEQDDKFCLIASKINKAVDRKEFEDVWKEIDGFKKEFGSTEFGNIDVKVLNGMLIDREMIVTA